MNYKFEEFRKEINDDRFVLPLADYQYSIEYVSVLPNSQIQQILPNFISSAVIRALNSVKDCPKNSINVEIGKADPEQAFKSDNAINFMFIANNIPIFDFGLTISSNGIYLRKQKSRISDLIDSLPIFQTLFDILFNPTATGEDEQIPPSLIDVLGIRDRIIRIGHTFKHNLSTLNHIANKNKTVSTIELCNKLLLSNLKPQPGITYAEHDCPVGSLSPEELQRCDATISFEKTINNKKRDVWIIANHPKNIKMQDVFLQFLYRMEESSTKIDVTDLTDFKTPIYDFYRDLILNRFMPNYFYDINFESKL